MFNTRCQQSSPRASLAAIAMRGRTRAVRSVLASSIGDALFGIAGLKNDPSGGPET